MVFTALFITVYTDVFVITFRGRFARNSKPRGYLFATRRSLGRIRVPDPEKAPILSKKFTDVEKDVFQDLGRAFNASPLSITERLGSFPRCVRRQDMARLLVRYEIFKLSLPAN